MVSPLRILHVVRPAAGGIRQHVISLITQSDSLRVSHAVAAPANFLGLLPPLPVTAKYPLEISARFALGHDLRAASRLARLARTVDVVHAHGLRAGWIAALARMITRFPLLVTAHNIAVEGSAVARLGAVQIGKQAQAIVCVSRPVADSLRAQGVPPEKIRIIPNGVDISYFSTLPDRQTARQALGLPGDAFVVGCIARLSPEKGVEVLLKAANLIPGIAVAIVGTGPEGDRLQAQCPPNARLLGPLEDIRALLAAADLLAIPSRSEGQGIVALEAMGAGVPIVASRVGGLADMLADQETAWLVPPNDPEALAEVLTCLQQSCKMRHDFAARAGTLVRERYDVRQMVQNILHLYETLSG